MSLEKVVFGFFVLLAATLNFGFVIGDISIPEQHNINELFTALAISLIAMVFKFGDRTQIGAVHLATSLVPDLQLIAAGGVGMGHGNFTRRTHGVRHLQCGLPLRWCTTCQPRLGSAARDRDRQLSPRVRAGEARPLALAPSMSQPPSAADVLGELCRAHHRHDSVASP